ncbi:MAG: 30S ribosomal protein S14 [Myxococcota bacterium]
MAKKSKINHNNLRREMAERYRDRREQLKELIRNPETPQEERFEAVDKLNKLPRNLSVVRVRNRCRVTGRPRAYYRKFEMSRVSLRDLGLSGQIAGLKKASW